jgi:cytochrome o ubiquinol oxidase subunit 2
MHRSSLVLLNPKGSVGERQRDLFIFTAILSMVVIIPVYMMAITIAWKYREGNTKAKYTPDWDHHNVLETIWWGIPGVIILVLAIVAWNTSHSLDPFKPLASHTKPLRIQVVALEWKWLFIYPEQQIATVNYLQIPKDTPINLEITSDAPMNSFWIPKLGGQVYAMSGMKTQLHLQANEVGIYDGSSANLSGEGFSGMRFKAKATDQRNFDKWLEEVANKPTALDKDEYAKLAKPSENVKPAYYAIAQNGLFDSVVDKYMAHGDVDHHEELH